MSTNRTPDTMASGTRTRSAPTLRLAARPAPAVPARGATTPDAKHRTNKRDVLALLDLIAGCVDNHPSQVFEKATWGHVGSIAYLRGRLMEIATGFALGADGSEEAARRRIEEALGGDDGRGLADRGDVGSETPSPTHPASMRYRRRPRVGVIAPLPGSYHVAR